MNEREQELNSEIAVAVQTAGAIATDADYREAGNAVRRIKEVIRNVKAYWEPIYDSAYSAYRAVLKKKKEMLTPLEEAEKKLKAQMSEYVMQKESAARDMCSSLSAQIQIEREQALAEAERAQTVGDAVTAEYARVQADLLAQTSLNTEDAVPAAEGIRRTRSWEIVSIDPGQVPVTAGGCVIRPVDEKMVLKVIKAAKGDISIPGVVFRETVNISVR